MQWGWGEGTYGLKYNKTLEPYWMMTCHNQFLSLFFPQELSEIGIVLFYTGCDQHCHLILFQILFSIFFLHLSLDIDLICVSFQSLNMWVNLMMMKVGA